MKIADFIDLDLIINSSAKPCVVSKDDPNVIIAKIELSDFKIFKSGIYRSQNNKMYFNGQTFWISNDFMNELKIKTKKLKCDISNLGISMREFLDPEMKNIDYNIDIEVFIPIINTNSDIYFFCSKNSKERYKNHLKKLEEKMNDLGLKTKNIYFISDTFFNKNEEEICNSKSRVILQHLIGLKSESDKFTDTEIEKYEQINFYDDNDKSIEVSKSINSILSYMISKSDDIIKTKIKDRVKFTDLILNSKKATHNKSNRYISSQTKLEYSNIIKFFEGFRS